MTHEPMKPDGRRCTCGANFKTPAELRRHVARKTETGERTVWITTPLPVQPHVRKGKRGSGK